MMGSHRETSTAALWLMLVYGLVTVERTELAPSPSL